MAKFSLSKKKSRRIVILSCFLLSQLAFVIIYSIPNLPLTQSDSIGFQEWNDGKVCIYPSTQSSGYPLYIQNVNVTIPLEPTTFNADLRMKFMILGTPDLSDINFSLLYLNGTAMLFEDVYEGYSGFSTFYNYFDGSQVVGILFERSSYLSRGFYLELDFLELVPSESSI